MFCVLGTNLFSKILLTLALQFPETKGRTLEAMSKLFEHGATRKRIKELLIFCKLIKDVVRVRPSTHHVFVLESQNEHDSSHKPSEDGTEMKGLEAARNSSRDHHAMV